MKTESDLRLSPADSAWLRMERPVNLMTITGVMTLKDPLEFARFRQVVGDRLAVYDRFRMKVVPPGGTKGRPQWFEDQFSLDEHVVPTRLTDPDSKEALQDFVSRQMSTPLDYDKPLWSFSFVEHFRGGSALVARIHHCIGDGIGLMKVVLGMTDPIDDPDIPLVGLSNSKAARQTLTRRARFLEAVRGSGAATISLARLLTLRADPPTRFRGELGREKRAVWSEGIPLGEVKALGTRLGGTINDVLMTAATGALHGYLVRHGRVAADLNIRATVPVNLRPPEDKTLGNKFGLIFLSLPVGLEHPLERLRELKRRMDRLKRSPEAFVAYGVLKTLGRMSNSLQGKVVQVLSKNATAVISNVPGPRGPLSLSGKEVEDIMFWVPQSGGVGLGVSIMSYNEKVRVGIGTDRGLVPDPETLVTAFHETLEELEATADQGI